LAKLDYYKINLTLLKKLIRETNTFALFSLFLKLLLIFSGKALLDLKCAMRHFAALPKKESFELDSVCVYEGTKSHPNLMYVYILSHSLVW